MRKMKRIPIIREVLEARLKKNELRIQAIAENSYKLRLAIEQIDAAPKRVPLTKADLEARANAPETVADAPTVVGVDLAAGPDATVTETIEVKGA